jgi:hypothetical protein
MSAKLGKEVAYWTRIQRPLGLVKDHLGKQTTLRNKAEKAFLGVIDGDLI